MSTKNNRVCKPKVPVSFATQGPHRANNNRTRARAHAQPALLKWVHHFELSFRSVSHCVWGRPPTVPRGQRGRATQLEVPGAADVSGGGTPCTRKVRKDVRSLFLAGSNREDRTAGLYRRSSRALRAPSSKISNGGEGGGGDCYSGHPSRMDGDRNPRLRCGPVINWLNWRMDEGSPLLLGETSLLEARHNSRYEFVVLLLSRRYWSVVLGWRASNL